jgi:hypothetical protein
MPSVVTVTTRSVATKKTTIAEPTPDEPTVKESNVKQNAAALDEAAEYSEAWTRMQHSMTPKSPVPMGVRTTVHLYVRV